MAEVRNFIVEESDTGIRIDKFLSMKSLLIIIASFKFI